MKLILPEAPSYLSPFFAERVICLSGFIDPGDQVKSVELTHNLGHNLTVYVSTFVPQIADEPGNDKVSHRWTDSVGTHYLKMPPYCLANLKQSKINMRQYLRHTRDVSLSMVEGTNDLTWHTIQRAIGFAASRRASSLAKPDYCRMK